MAVKKRNQADATLRNVRAAAKRYRALVAVVAELEARISALEAKRQRTAPRRQNRGGNA
jgi:hypothetical protein